MNSSLLSMYSSPAPGVLSVPSASDLVSQEVQASQRAAAAAAAAAPAGSGVGAGAGIDAPAFAPPQVCL